MNNKIGVLIVLFLTIFGSMGSLYAQDYSGEIPKFNIQRWRPGPMPGDFLTTYGTQSEESLRVTGGFYLNYSHNAFQVKQSGTKSMLALLQHSLYGDFFASFSLFEYVELSVVLPVAFYQKSDAKIDPLRSQINGTAGLGDMRFLVKGRILDMRKFPVGLALIADLSAPTAKNQIFAGDDGVSFTLTAALEYAPWEGARLGFNVGYRYRPAVELYQYTMGQSILLSAAAAIPFFHKDLDLLFDLGGEITVDGKNKTLVEQERPFEADLAFRYRFINDKSWARGLSMTAGVGTGITAVGAPDVRALLGLHFHWVNGGNLWVDYEYGGFLSKVEACPDPDITPFSQIPEHCRRQEIDSDGDTIPDYLDKCPFQGRVGYIDEDGCPVDSDGDTIPDYEDLCPHEGVAGEVDKHGCPIKYVKVEEEPEEEEDPNAKVRLKDGKIDIKEQVFFETSKAKIKQESFELLNQVADLLNANPHIGNIEIEGHTDSKGKYSYNKRLSQNRADSVKDYLVKRGVEKSRLKAIGYGPDQPIADNETEEGRAQNRRVEFTVKGLDEI